MRLHVTEMKSLPGMKKILFTREFHPEMKRENLPSSMKNLLLFFRVRLHVTEMKSHDKTRPGMKKFLFTLEFHPGMKRVEFHPGMKFNLKENLPLSIKTYNKTYNFSLIC